MEERSPQELTASDSTPQLVRSFAASQKCRSHWQQPVLRNLGNVEKWRKGRLERERHDRASKAHQQQF